MYCKHTIAPINITLLSRDIQTQKCFFGMLAVSLVHRECRYESKMATQVEKAKCVIWFIETNSATNVKRLYLNTYRKVPPTRKSIYAWRKQFEGTGCLCKGKSPEGLSLLTIPYKPSADPTCEARRNQQTVLLVSYTYPSQPCERFYASD
jgi:hypothetical protein